VFFSGWIGIHRPWDLVEEEENDEVYSLSTNSNSETPD